MSTGETEALGSGVPRRDRPWLRVLHGASQHGRAQLGFVLLMLLVGIAAVGPFFAPYSPTEFPSSPFTPPSSHLLFGSDVLGRDVLSRFLWGGRSILILSTLATLIGLVLGVAIGLTAAYFRGSIDDALMRTMDVVIAFPQLVFALVLVSTLGPHLWLLVLAVAATTMPRIARLTRGISSEVVEREFIQSAEAIGASRARIMFGEILPNITTPLIVEASLRLSFNVAIIAGLSFLGFGIQPPNADWGLMINENRIGLSLQPWPVILPVLAIGLLTIATSLIGDGIARATIGIEGGGESSEK